MRNVFCFREHVEEIHFHVPAFPRAAGSLPNIVILPSPSSPHGSLNEDIKSAIHYGDVPGLFPRLTGAGIWMQVFVTLS
jgi:hypothetical protein